MDYWAAFWTIVFALTIMIYTGLVLVITFGGWKDVAAMFKTLDEQQGETHQNSDE